MSQLRVLRAADYPRMPWKNGAGTTLEILRDDAAGDGLEGFGWRLSIADVGQSGGFSLFTGYHRIITVLEGDGMQLTIDGQRSRPLRALDALAFSGDSQVDCRLLGGPIRDFNLIYSPDRCSVRLQWLTAGVSTLFSSAKTVLVFSAGEGLRVSFEGETQTVGRYDCLQVDDAGLRPITFDASAAYCLIEIE
mgnify:CR=1 FL=1